MTETLVEQYVKDPERMRLFQQERAIHEVVHVLESLMNEMGITRAKLAKRLGKSRGWVTQLLDGDANKTIRTVADAFAVLGKEYHSSYSEIRISNAVDAPHSLRAISPDPADPQGTIATVYSNPPWKSVVRTTSVTTLESVTM